MKIFIAISFHGFGHLAQAAPLINALFLRHPDWEWVIQCNAAREQLARWIKPDFVLVRQDTDLGIPMINAVRADAEATWHQYQQAHQARAQHVAAMRYQLEQHRPDLVLSNTSYWASAAAAELNLPCFHFCSLNWADTFYSYCHNQPDAAEIYQALCNDYNRGDIFFRLPPYMAMPGLQLLEDVGPVCRVGCKHDLHAHFGHAATIRHVLVTMGGLPYPMPYERWPCREDLFFLNAGPPASVRPDIRNVADSGISHLDLVASCDLVLTKPGYGTFLEAACAGTPILYLPRNDWPEEPPLLEWQRRHGYCRAITEAQFLQGDFVADLERTLREVQTVQQRPPVSPTGIDTIIARIEQQLGWVKN